MQLQQGLNHYSNNDNNLVKNLFLIKIWLLLVLFFPVKYFIFYHLVILLPLLIFTYFNGGKLNLEVKILLCFIFYLIVTAIIRFLFNPENIRDVFEIFRFMPLLVFFMLKDKLNTFFDYAVKYVCGYIALNFVVSLFQYKYKFDSIIVNIVRVLYNSPKHFEESLMLNSRALGLSMGPNSNAVIVLLCIIFILFKFIPKTKIEYIYKISILCLGLISLILSQSQTGLIAMMMVVTCIFISLFIRSPMKTGGFLAIIISIFILLPNTKFLDKFGDRETGFYYLSTLFEQGTERSSYVLREEKRDYMLDEALSEPRFALIGWGKDFFGEYTSATDNEHLYLVLVYGPLVWLLIVGVALVVSLKYLYSYFSIGRFKELFVPSIMLSAVIFALPAAFITYPQSLILAALFLNYDYKECLR
ncbi:hypothetical protein [Vibrio fluvialis]|uniref:hypothetical protein n=1 Tax=Vibrio fluvialis TaxID=676 RepID=UPI003D7D0FE9